MMKKVVSGLYIASVVSLGIAGIYGSTTKLHNKAFAAERPGLVVEDDSIFDSVEKKGMVVNVNTDLVVRKAPSEKAEILDKLKNEKEVTVCFEMGNWYEIKYDGKRGYASKDFIKIQEEDLSMKRYILDTTGGNANSYVSREDIMKKNMFPIEELNNEEKAKEVSNESKDNAKTEEASAGSEEVQAQPSVEENKAVEAVSAEPVIKGRAVQAELTAYCNGAECSGNWGGQTAMETTTRIGVVAAPVEVALGSKIYIPELQSYKADGIFSVEDRGGAIKIKDDGTYIIDIWMPTHEQVEAFGRKKVTIYLMD